MLNKATGFIYQQKKHVKAHVDRREPVFGEGLGPLAGVRGPQGCGEGVLKSSANKTLLGAGQGS